MSGPAPEAPPPEDLDELYEQAPCGYLSMYPDGRICKINETLAKWLGYSKEDILGKRLHDFLNIAGRIFYETHFAPLLRMQGFFNEVALDFVTQGGAMLPMLVNAAERRDRFDVHLGTRLTLFNATDRRRYERELVSARAVAEAANDDLRALRDVLQGSLANEREAAALREQFIAVLGHDLRNPLAAIDASLQVLARMPQTDRAASVIQTAGRSAKRMGALIDNIMDFARGRLGGGLTLDRSGSEPVEAVLRHVVAELSSSMPERVIETRYEIIEPVDCDRRRIAQLASNLLSNALTHGAPDAAVRLTARTSEGWFDLSISNRGEPISAAQQACIFEPFSRAGSRPSMQGLGLGLYISKKVAEAHRGTLELISAEEETRFTLRMPTAPGLDAGGGASPA